MADGKSSDSLTSFLNELSALDEGVFTPAVSVTSAVGGIAIAKPSIGSDIIPISIVSLISIFDMGYLTNPILSQAFLVVLFLAQPFGTHRLAAGFAPGERSCGHHCQLSLTGRPQ